jgi:hypothetical protein
MKKLSETQSFKGHFEGEWSWPSDYAKIVMASMWNLRQIRINADIEGEWLQASVYSTIVIISMQNLRWTQMFNDQIVS